MEFPFPRPQCRKVATSSNTRVTKGRPTNAIAEDVECLSFGHIVSRTKMAAVTDCARSPEPHSSAHISVVKENGGHMSSAAHREPRNRRFADVVGSPVP